MPEDPLILVVDDVADGRQMYVMYLTHHGYRVIEATNGVEAIEQAYSHRPAAILMDLGMPHVDGWEAIRRIKTEARTRDIPVLAISGHAFQDAVARAAAAGADAFLIKPCPPALVLAKLREVINRSNRSP